MNIKVTFRNLITKEFPKGVSLLEIAESFQNQFEFPILLAKVDNEIEELDKVITKKCSVDFYDRSSIVGNSIYTHGAHFIMIVAVKRVLGSDAEVVVEHSIDKGVYCEITTHPVDAAIIEEIETSMREIVKQDLRFVKVSVTRRDAIEFFKKRKQIDKVNVLKYISNTFINLYRLDECYDYFFSDMPFSTKYIDEFKLTYIEGNGFSLATPTIHNPGTTAKYVHHKMLFDAFLNYTELGRTLGITTAADLNEFVSTGKYNELIRLSEVNYNNQLMQVAEEIYGKNGKVKIVLIAGPSSSGKTTTSKKLETFLQTKGYKTHAISTDDYFFNRVDTPKDENGKYDFESIKAVDINLFNKHLVKLMDGEKVHLPEYNFVTGEREFKKRFLQLAENDIIIIEGLHALSDDLTMAIDNKNKYKIYIGPLTQLNIDNHNRIHTSDTRRLRRIVRDHKYRGYNASDTLSRWPEILVGEEKWVFPYQNSANFIVNSALIYELGVLKTYAEPLLFSVSGDDEVYPEALRLINFLRNFLPIPSDDVPKDSVLREFIGGSCFHDK